MHIEKRQWVWAAVGFGVSSIPRIILALVDPGYALLYVLGLYSESGIVFFIFTQFPISLFFGLLFFLTSGVREERWRRSFIYLSTGLLFAVTLSIIFLISASVGYGFDAAVVQVLYQLLAISLAFACALFAVGWLPRKQYRIAGLAAALIIFYLLAPLVLRL